MAASDAAPGYDAVPVSPDDVRRVVLRALADGTQRIRLTHGQGRAIVHARLGPEAARA